MFEFSASAMDTSGTGFFNDSTTGGAPAKKGRSRGPQNLVPLCVRQILTLPEVGGEFKLFHLPVPMVNIVGILRDFEIQSTKATCKIEDHTGTIDAVLWLENDGGNVNVPTVAEGNYVEVFGSIRVHDGARNVMILKLFPVSDANLITNHLLQVIHVRLEAEALGRTPIPSNNPGLALAKSMNAMDDNPSTSDTGLNPIQDKIYKLIMSSGTSDSGLHIDMILKHFGTHQQRDVRRAVQFLSDEGHIYTTIDADHYKATNCI